MDVGLETLERTNWARLVTAYGSGEDAPVHLRALLEGDDDARTEACQYLWSAVLHQGTAFPITGPAARVVAGILADPRVRAAKPDVRRAMLQFLADVATALERSGATLEEAKQVAAFDLDPILDAGKLDEIFEGPAGEAVLARGVVGCVEARPAIRDAAVKALDDPDASVRLAALSAALVFVRAEPPELEKSVVEARLAAMLSGASSPDEKAGLLLTLGELGGAPAAMLEDPAPVVRLCAALAPALAGDERATGALLQLLERHAGEMDDWFQEKPPQFPMRVRFAVVRALLDRVTEFERLAPAAVAVAKTTTATAAAFEWGPLLSRAFPDGSGVVTTDGQRHYLEALVANEALWKPAFGNPERWFREAGLPYDRAECEKRARG